MTRWANLANPNPFHSPYKCIGVNEKKPDLQSTDPDEGRRLISDAVERLNLAYGSGCPSRHGCPHRRRQLCFQGEGPFGHPIRDRRPGGRSRPHPRYTVPLMTDQPTTLVVASPGELAPMSAAEVKARIALVHDVMKSVMRIGEHYGPLPGAGPKPILFKPGAEKLLATFRLAPEHDVEDLSGPDAIRYRVTTRLTHSPTGTFLGQGLGEASTLEEKWKWRRAVCDAEWDETPEDRRRTKWSKRGKNQKPTKVKQVRTEPADLANTVLKMATKRSLVAAVLTVTAASDIFAEYTEYPDGADARNQRRGQQAAQASAGRNRDARSNSAGNGGPGRARSAATSQGNDAQSGGPAGGGDIDHADKAQFDRFQAVAHLLGLTLDDQRELLRARGVDRFGQLTADQAFDLIAMLEKEQRERARAKQDGALFAE